MEILWAITILPVENILTLFERLQFGKIQFNPDQTDELTASLSKVRKSWIIAGDFKQLILKILTTTCIL